MHRIERSALSCLLLFPLLLAGSAAHGFGGMIAIGQGPANGRGLVEVPFTADAVMKTADHQVKTRIYYAPGKVRDDIEMQGQKMTYIQRFDLGKTWMLMAPTMYMEFDIDQLKDKGDSRVQQYELVTRKVVGKETVGGQETTKYEVVYQTSDGRYDGFTWFTDDNIAVKCLMGKQGGGKNERVSFEMTNLKRGAQAGSLFELPKGATKLDMGSMGMMMGDATRKSAEGAASEASKSGNDAAKRALEGLFR